VIDSIVTEINWDGPSLYPRRKEKINGRLPRQKEMSYDFLSHVSFGASIL
jgi:hypothetical protein